MLRAALPDQLGAFGSPTSETPSIPVSSPARTLTGMETLGAPELLIILALALLFFGANKLPEIGKGLGSAIKGFKAGLKEEPETAALTSNQTDQR